MSNSFTALFLWDLNLLILFISSFAYVNLTMQKISYSFWLIFLGKVSFIIVILKHGQNFLTSGGNVVSDDILDYLRVFLISRFFIFLIVLLFFKVLKLKSHHSKLLKDFKYWIMTGYDRKLLWATWVNTTFEKTIQLKIF